MVEELIIDICEMLCIPAPSVSFDASCFPTDTTMAQCSPDGAVIYIKKCEKPDPDSLFAVAHELRHIWQMNTDRSRYLSEYKPVDLCASIEEYNLQMAEIDANAFAGLVMIDFFHIKPLFKNLSDRLKNEIHGRMEEIQRTEAFRFS